MRKIVLSNFKGAADGSLSALEKSGELVESAFPGTHLQLITSGLPVIRPELVGCQALSQLIPHREVLIRLLFRECG
jgi:hypothetical protein